MILRRVTEHVRAQNWTAIGIDFFIVVLGVFIGLQVQEWSQLQADRQREIQIVSELLDNLEIDRANYANGLPWMSGRSPRRTYRSRRPGFRGFSSNGSRRAWISSAMRSNRLTRPTSLRIDSTVYGTTS